MGVELLSAILFLKLNCVLIPLSHTFKYQNILITTSKKHQGLLMKVVLLMSYYFSRKLIFIPWAQKSEKAHESKY